MSKKLKDELAEHKRILSGLQSHGKSLSAEINKLDEKMDGLQDEAYVNDQSIEHYEEEIKRIERYLKEQS